MKQLIQGQKYLPWHDSFCTVAVQFLSCRGKYNGVKNGIANAGPEHPRYNRGRISGT